MADANWKTKNPWADRLYANALVRARVADGRNDLGGSAVGVASDFYTYANTALARFKGSRSPMALLWLWRFLRCVWLARRYALVAFFQLSYLDGVLQLFVRHEDFAARDHVSPRGLADRLQTLADILLKTSKVFWQDGEFADKCVKMGLYLVSQACGVRLHTAGLLSCDALFLALRNNNEDAQTEHYNRAVLIAGELMSKLGGSVASPPTYISIDNEHVARQTGRILRKIAEYKQAYAKRSDSKDEGGLYKKAAKQLFEVTGSHNQTMRLA
jgi:hypothetical protein